MYEMYMHVRVLGIAVTQGQWSIRRDADALIAESFSIRNGSKSFKKCLFCNHTKEL